MSTLVRCRACGYVMREDRVGEVCPACGFRRSVFEPYQERISPRRKFLLDLDAHPILVHFPQTFASILPPLVVVHLLFPALLATELVAVIQFTALALPLSALGALASGLLDGKVKLKRLGTPALVRKMVAGGALVAFSAVNALVVAVWGLQGPARIVVLALALACFASAVLLGMMGKKLIPAVLPG